METGSSIVRTVLSLTAVLVVAAVFAAPAAAHHPSPVPEALLEKALGEGVSERPDGLYRVRVDGPDLITHGPDVMLNRPAPRESGFSAGAPERDPVCANSNIQHILYGRITGTANNFGSSVEAIRTTMRRTNAVLNQDSLASGGSTADYRMKCAGGGAIQVDAFTAVGFDFNSVVNGARAAGFDATDVDYTVFFDSSAAGACGIGSYFDDDRLSANNYNNSGGGYAIVYKGCWSNDTAMHENGHNQGAVQYGAPYSTGSGGHCWDDIDVMCYAPDGGDKHQTGTISRCTDRTYFDCGYDTYFDAAPEPGEWLASHWNIGSPLNRFIDFGAGGSGGNTAPGASFNYSCTGLACDFTSTSTDSDGSLVSQVWTFGDGNGGSGGAASHSYSGAGSYQVRLTVTDNDGDSDSMIRTVAVSSPESEPGGGIGAVGPRDAIKLINGALETASSTATGGWSDHFVKVPRRSKVLKVTLKGPACNDDECNPDLDLYLRHRKHPTLQRADCAPQLSGSREVCKIRKPRKGKWFIGVHAYEASAGADYALRAVAKKKRRR